MKEKIFGLEKDWVAYIYGIIGILLIIFPEQLTNAIPYLLGASLLAHGVFGIISIVKYKDESTVKVGKVVTDFVLGGAIMYHNADAIGVIGALWAMMSLDEAAEEITEAFESKKFTLLKMIIEGITIFLAVVLMFNPFEHFAFHVRVLGLEVLLSVFVRDRNLFAGEKKEKDEEEE